ncbi:MAG: feruloyl-CoA synthase [Burkholderiaceae bacterium]|nr:feruloyl-CoA synthase [Burkholderiaceae bacterium]
MTRYRAARVDACLDVECREAAGGIRLLRSPVPLQPFPDRLTDRLEHWAREAPARTLAARREHGGDWRHVSYAQMVARARAIGQALVDRGLSPQRPVAILSGNDLEHLALALGAMWAGVPSAPVSPAYSLLSQDHGRLRHILGTLTPGLVFASGPEYARAIRAVVDPDVELVLADGCVDGRVVTPFDTLLATVPRAGVDAAHARVGPDTIARFLFTSGSTRAPKGVINTHRMLCANQQMIRQGMAFLADEPPVLVDWLPWNHTFGGNHNVGIAIYNGGTLYIDDGKPTPQGIGETLRNLREISPTVYFNVPRGFEEIVAAMRDDAVLRASLLRRVKAFMFAGAGLSQPVWDELDRLAEQAVGERIPMITGLGMTETAPSCTFALRAGAVRSGHVGLPCPGVEVKLVPLDGKTEIRFRGPHVMPGYWRLPEASASAFDEEGYYRTGDAVTWVDPADPRQGLVFDGRIAEDFKLATGTFVSVGPLRARILAAGAPYVQDAVITGIDRDEVGMLVFPRLDECRSLAGLPLEAAPADVLRHPAVRAVFQALLDRLWREGTGSASRVARAHVMAAAPSIDRDEITDKGSINQRAVLRNRAALVEALYRAAGDDADEVLRPTTAPWAGTAPSRETPTSAPGTPRTPA